MIKHLEKEADFAGEIAEGKVLVDFYADWCGPCQMLSPVIEQLEQESGIKVIKIDVDSLPNLARQYRVMAIPTLLLFEDGQMKKRETAYMPIEHLRRFVS